MPCVAGSWQGHRVPWWGCSTLFRMHAVTLHGRGAFSEHTCPPNLFGCVPHACPCALRRSTGDGRLDSKSELASSSVLGKLLVQTSVPGATGSLPHTHLLRSTWSQAFYPECHELIDHLNWFLCRLLNLLPVNGCVHSYLRFVTSGRGCSWSLCDVRLRLRYLCSLACCLSRVDSAVHMQRELLCHAFECFPLLTKCLSAFLNSASCPLLCVAIVTAASSTDHVNLERMHTSEGAACLCTYAPGISHFKLRWYFAVIFSNILIFSWNSEGGRNLLGRPFILCLFYLAPNVFFWVLCYLSQLFVKMVFEVFK